MNDIRNKDRAGWAEIAVDEFQTVTRTDNEDAVCDLLCNLMHFCDLHGDAYRGFDEGLRRARAHYEAETSGEEE